MNLEEKALLCGFQVVDKTIRYPPNGPTCLSQEQIQFLAENKGEYALFFSAKVHDDWVKSSAHLITANKPTSPTTPHRHKYSMIGYADYPRDRSRLDRDHMYAMISIAAACRAGLRDKRDSKIPHNAIDVGCVIRTSALVHNRRQVCLHYNSEVSTYLTSFADQIISIGWNGYLPELDPDARISTHIQAFTKKSGLLGLHAEVNAILLAQQPLHEAVLYTTLFPCDACAKAICQAGIGEVNYMFVDRHSWLSPKIFDEYRVIYR